MKKTIHLMEGQGGGEGGDNFKPEPVFTSLSLSPFL